MERKLATIQKIEQIDPIQEADSLEVATVLGWKVVVKKNEFQSGDLCVFIEIDSILPKDNPEFEFMRAHKFRVKTIKLRGQISQGLCFPIPKLLPPDKSYTIGLDVSKDLKITKYEGTEPVELSGDQKGNFPSFIPKTDATRLQTHKKLVEEIRQYPYVVTEKIDGTSATYFIKNGEFGVCSRNVELKESESNLYWKIAEKYKIKETLKNLNQDKNTDFAIQGEIAGTGIQQNRLDLPDKQFFVFDIYQIQGGGYLPYPELLQICNQYGLKTVPHILTVAENQTWTDYYFFLNLSKGNSLLNPNKNKEGIVVRTLKQQYSLILKGRLGFKVISEDYLLQEKDEPKKSKTKILYR